MKGSASKMLELFQDKEFLIILGSVTVIFCLLVFIITRIVKRKKKNKVEDAIENSIPTQNTMNTNVISPDKGKKKEKKKKQKRKSKKEIAFEEERNLCIQGYNELYAIYLNAGYSVDLNENETLAFYNSQIVIATDMEQLKDIQTNISFEKSRIVSEIERLQRVEYIKKRREELHPLCVELIVEIENICSLVNINGKDMIKEYNSRLLNQSRFDGLDEYEKLYEELKYNVSYLKKKYESILENNCLTDEKEIDVKLIHSLKLLECDIHEKDMAKIKKKYLALVNKYHPDKNGDSRSSIEMTSQLNEAYKYIKKCIEKKEN